jgi:hypothetical protein
LLSAGAQTWLTTINAPSSTAACGSSGSIPSLIARHANAHFDRRWHRFQGRRREATAPPERLAHPPLEPDLGGQIWKVALSTKWLTPGKTLNPLLSVSALALAASAAVNAGNAQAILVYEFLEEGANVRLNVSGLIDRPSKLNWFF